MAVPKAHVVFVLDDSGSMTENGKCVATIQAYNAYVDTLAKVKGAEVHVSLCKFGGHGLSTKMQWNAPVQDAVRLSDANYHPNDGTEIYLAIIQAIQAVEAELKKSGPRKVVLCIQTDGASGITSVNDDGSIRYGGSGPLSCQLAHDMLKQKMAAGWEIIFMAANDGHTDFLDVAGRTLGIPRDNIMVYGTDKKATTETFAAAAWNIGAYTAGRKASVAFTDEQRKKAKG
jgi:hypothetical protein